MGEIFKLFGTIGVDNKEANKALDETEKKGQGTGNKLTNFFKKMSTSVGNTFSGLGKKIDFSGVSKQFNSLGGKINSSLANGVKTGAKAIVVGGTAAMASAGALLVKSMNMGGELEQNMGGSTAVFGKYAQQMQKTGVNAFKNMGLSQSDFLANANKMGSLYQGAGFSVKESMTMTSDSMQRAADVASIMGINADDAMEAVSGMAKGNFEMMDNLGVAMNDTTIGNYALSKGIKKSTADMTTQEKVGLATQMFMEKTAKYAGNYAKENDTLSGSFQTAKGALSNFMSGAGNIDSVIQSGMKFAGVAGKAAMELAPKLFEGISKAVQTLVPRIPSMIGSLVNNLSKTIGEMFGQNAKTMFDSSVDAISQALDGLKSAFDFIVKYKDIFMPIAVGIGAIVGFLAAWNAITTIATAVQTAFNIVLNANPISLIILAIVGLVAGLTYFFTQTKLGQQIWQNFTQFLSNAWSNLKTLAVQTFTALGQFFTNLWQGIKDVAVIIWNAIVTGIVSLIISVVSTAVNLFNSLKNGISNIFNGISIVASTIWNAIKAFLLNVVNGIKNTIINIFNATKNTISTIFNGIRNIASTVWNGIKSTISNIVNGIKNTVSNVFNGVRGLVSSIFNGIRSVTSSVWNAIKSTISNVVNGVKNTISNVWSGITGIVSRVFNGVKSAIEGPMNSAKNIIRRIIDTIKGFFNFSISWPHIPVPSFSISPAGWKIGDLLKGKIPSLGISWHADGGIFDEPTLLSSGGGQLHGVGEAGAEAVAPIDTLLDYVRQAVMEVMGQDDGDINVTQYITSPHPLTPREIARQTKLQLQDLAALRKK
ncbi:hypothetical protein FC84_GL001650 [Lapidilactobacillus dextrinicus DSM 20335]|uniref:Uncharacterized protein n=1 Tax=Lapidilactobacillus dextrinicus DSM 20335 TaxID=1423738 RepID=A0A0R2BIV7_9LACO|nr:hypothetical protein [Lapidilactobacillus dextrinicus]KRM79470.1 hypothetical protein FC84_GL001650 [Lapidilactobacillus dextrinicus DSM 20335]QFG46694.1 hypothetical protein LH506_04210 [Lapidilactobacillus dextrinicus]